MVRSGEISNSLYLRHGWQPRAERVVDGLQGPLLQVDISQFIVHEGDEPNAVVDFSDSEAPPGKHGGDGRLDGYGSGGRREVVEARPGDTLESLAAVRSAPLWAVYRLNSVKPGQPLPGGAQIVLPG